MKPVSCKQETGRHRKALVHRASQDPALYHFDPVSLFVLRAQDSDPYIRADRDCGLCPGAGHGPRGHRGGHSPHPPSPVLGCCLQTSKGHVSHGLKDGKVRIRSGKMALQAGKARVQNWHPGYIHVFEQLGKLEMG